MEVVHSSEGPLREVPLYTVAQVCALETYIYIPYISQCGCPCSSLPVPPRSVTRRQTSGPLDTHHSSSDSLQTREGWQRSRNTFMKTSMWGTTNTVRASPPMNPHHFIFASEYCHGIRNITIPCTHPNKFGFLALRKPRGSSLWWHFTVYALSVSMHSFHYN